MTALILTLGLLMAGAPAHPGRPMSATEVARRLDVTTFPNSTGPERRPDARTLRDYGFTRMEPGDRGDVYLHRDQAEVRWTFGIRVLTWSEGKGMLCISDIAQNGGSYFQVRPLEVEEGPDGLLRATGRRVKASGCPERRQR